MKDAETHSRTVVRVHLLFLGDVKQPTAVQLALQVCLGLVVHHLPRRAQKLLLENVNRINKSQRFFFS